MLRRFGFGLLLLSVVLVVVGIGLVYWLVRQQPVNGPDQTGDVVSEIAEEREEHLCGLPSADTVAAQEVVRIGSAGFAPDTVAIKVGETVRWVNEDTGEHQVASDPHPLHTNCLGLESEALSYQQQFGFTFTKPGTWHYHDHLNPVLRGQVLVTE